MPESVLRAMAKHFGGELLLNEMPPFVVMCSDGLAIVITMRVGGDYMGAAFALSSSYLPRLDHGILELWRRSKKEQTIDAFFAGTTFASSLEGRPQLLPPHVEEPWKSSYC
jgi:hypothetical protein